MTKQTKTALWIVGGLIAIGVIGSLGSIETDSPDVLTECLEAFQAAHEVDPMQDTHADLYPAFHACATLDEWTAANERYPEAIDGADPVTYALNVCESAEAEAVQGSPVCEAVAETEEAQARAAMEAEAEAYVDEMEAQAETQAQEATQAGTVTQLQERVAEAFEFEARAYDAEARESSGAAADFARGEVRLSHIRAADARGSLSYAQGFANEADFYASIARASGQGQANVGNNSAAAWERAAQAWEKAGQ